MKGNASCHTYTDEGKEKHDETFERSCSDCVHLAITPVDGSPSAKFDCPFGTEPCDKFHHHEWLEKDME